MYEPSPSGFDSPGLADLFKVPYHGPSTSSAPTPTSTPSEGSRPNHRTAIIIGCSVGGIVGLTLVIGLGLRYRKQIHHRITGIDFPPQEMDNQERNIQEMDNQQNLTTVQEMDDQQTFIQEIGTENKSCWELPADNKPIEMWTPTTPLGSSEEGSSPRSLRSYPVVGKDPINR